MPRRGLLHAGGVVFHVLNRSVRRNTLFFDDGDYAAFENVLAAALARIPIRLLAYSVMPNHWHLVLWPYLDELPRFMHWLTLTHAKRWHEAHDSYATGHVYQNRYRAVPVQSDFHLLTLLRYVERNPQRAKLVTRAEEWRWGSLWRRCNSCDDIPLCVWPILQPPDWVDLVNSEQPLCETELIRRALAKGRPIGNDEWTAENASRFGLRLRDPGRPRKRK